MDFDTLRIFVEVVRQQNITRASALLNVAQPAVTRRIRALESTLGIPLLARHPRGVQPTEAGAILFERAEMLLRSLDEIPQELLSRAAEPSGQVRFAFPPGLGSVFVFGMVTEYLMRYPRVQLILHEDFSRAVREALLAGRVDMGLMSCAIGHVDLQCTPLYEEPLWVIGRAAGWPFGKGSVLDLKKLVGHPLLISSFLRLTLEQAGLAQGLRFDVRLEANAYMSVYEGARRGIGFLVAPPSTVAKDLKSGQLVGMAVRGLHVSRGLFWRNDRPLNQALLQLAAAVQAEAAKLRAQNPKLFRPLLADTDTGS